MSIKLIIRLLMLIGFTSILLTGCGHMVENYSPSFNNIAQLQTMKKSVRPIALGQFTATTPNQRVILCRLEGNESLPGNQTYEQYIQNAFQNELQSSELLAPASNIVLTGNLDKIKLNSVTGHWIIQMTFTSNTGKPFTVSSDYSFSTNYVADIACEEAAKAFVPAVQQFLGNVYANPNFKSLVTKK